jgi:type VI secretion system secreted protein VgrG
MATTQQRRIVSVKSPLGEDVLLFRQMTAREELGRLSEFHLDLLSENESIKMEDVLGKKITVKMALSEGGERFFNGYVSRFAQIERVQGLAHYEATLKPWLWFLTRTADCRIFQDKTIPEIIKEIFRDHGFSDFKESLNRTYKPKVYCVQYRETDFNFVSRLMEQEGIYYFFEHEDDKHTMVLADSYSAHHAIKPAEIPYLHADELAVRERDHISEWFVSQEIQPGAFALNDFDFEKPRASASGSLKVKSLQKREHALADYEIYDYPGEYTESGDGESYAKTWLESLQAQHEQTRGSGDARGLAVGGLFKLTEYPREDQNREYLITSANYSFGVESYESGGGSGIIFNCNFQTIPSKQPYRAARITPKPMVQGPQTAIVVGKAGEEIWTDKYGRIKVQFHWDRYGKADENSSCWVRVSHPWAGKGWGSISIPRLGQEVIVDFLEGDPDEPIVTGRVYNGDQTPPFALPGKAMVSGVKSNSTKGGGGNNEISLDDTKGSERIFIHGQFNMDTVIDHDQTSTIHNNRTDKVDVDDSETVGNNQTQSVGVDQSVSIGSNQKTRIGVNHTVAVGADESTTIGANQTLKVGANQSESVGAAKTETIAIAKALTIGAGYQVTVGAAMNETIGGLKAEEIGGAKIVSVAGLSSENVGASKSTNAGSNISENAGGNISNTAASNISASAGSNVSASAGSNFSASAGSDFSGSAGGKMGLSSGGDFSASGGAKGSVTMASELSLVCGGASIVLKSGGQITIKGTDITIEGSGKITGKAGGNMKMTGAKILQN